NWLICYTDGPDILCLENAPVLGVPFAVFRKERGHRTPNTGPEDRHGMGLLWLVSPGVIGARGHGVGPRHVAGVRWSLQGFEWSAGSADPIGQLPTAPPSGADRVSALRLQTVGGCDRLPALRAGLRGRGSGGAGRPGSGCPSAGAFPSRGGAAG